MMRIGFIGLGSMGLPMAKNLAARGFAVRGFDIRPGAIDSLAEAGGARASAPADAADGADVLVLMRKSGCRPERSTRNRQRFVGFKLDVEGPRPADDAG
jgi:pyrroline-5-carboxylate reductase